jgi:hypothetical protein
METIQSDHFGKALLLLLEETFEQVHGLYLDKGTSLFETLAGITSRQASIPVGGKCATLAAQVKHVAFYLDVLERTVIGMKSGVPSGRWTLNNGRRSKRNCATAMCALKTC